LPSYVALGYLTYRFEDERAALRLPFRLHVNLWRTDLTVPSNAPAPYAIMAQNALGAKGLLPVFDPALDL
jgi:hypothetical protein